jgi:hypothetical protein
MPKEVPEHRDKLGRLLNVGDCVAYPSSNSLVIGIVKKLNPKMVGVSQLGKNRWGAWGDSNKYSNDLVILDGPDVTMYLIKNSG